MPKGLVTMSAKEIDRGELIRQVREKRLTQPKAAALMGLSVRQVKRLCRLFKDDGLSGQVDDEVCSRTAATRSGTARASRCRSSSMVIGGFTRSAA
jgi:hypothetical protein